MYGTTFGDKHTQRDWGLYLPGRPTISPPKPDVVIQQIPGSNAALDLSETLTGDITYGQRTFSATYQSTAPRQEWAGIYSDIMDYLHGRRLKIIYDHDPSYYYLGRISVVEWKDNGLTASVTISADCDPFKYEISSSLEDWKWDPFSFEDGVIREYADLRVEGTYTLSISGSRKPVVPTFIVDSDDGSGLQVKFKGTTYSLPDGSSRAPDLVIREGEHELTFSGSGTVSVDYRGGRL